MGNHTEVPKKRRWRMLKSQQSRYLTIYPNLTKMSDFSAVQTQLLNYFKGVVKITNDHMPPGKNVSDGNFGELIAKDPTIMACYQSLTIGDQKLKQVFENSFQNIFYLRSSLSFKTRTKVAISPSQQAELIAEKYIIMPFKQVSTIIKDITSIVTLDLATVKNLITDAKDYWDAVQQEDFRVTGQFANGWIAIDLKKAADAANLALPPINDPTQQTDKLIAVMSAFYAKVSSWSHGSRTQDDGNDPWLKADWQTQFNAACSATAQSIASIP